jgi:uncharacterized protein YbjT (DUF2867 family)
MRIAVAGGTGVVGQHVVASLAASGHDPVVLSRSTGVDLTSGIGLAIALDGASAVVDVTSTSASSAAASSEFFRSVTTNLLAAERQAGVPHHVTLSIVGAAAVNADYYAGKKVQEDLVLGAGTGWTMLRATQFHEFAVQLLPRGAIGPIQGVPTMVSQPVAASEVGELLARLATRAPAGLVSDLAGPKVERMSHLVRRYLRAIGSRRPVLQVPLRGAFGRSLRDGSLLPGTDAQLGTQTFDEWLALQPEVRAAAERSVL